MRRSLGKFSNSAIGNATGLSLRTSPAFSTSAGSGGGGGRGRGRGSSLSASPNSQFADPNPPGKADHVDHDDDGPKLKPGLGRGRGKPLPSSPTLPAFSFISAVNGSSTGRGRAPAAQSDSDHPGPKRPIFFSKNDSTTPAQSPIGDTHDSNLSSTIISALSGAGRGKPAKPFVSSDQPVEKDKVENRHLRARPSGRGRSDGAERSPPGTPKLSREDAVKKAVGILSKGDDVGDRTQKLEDGGGRGRGFRGRERGFRGRGRGRGRWEDRGRGRGRDIQDGEDNYGAGLYLGDNADGEKLAKRIGAENMDKLVEAFEEMSGRVLPSPMEDAYLDALHTNLMIECEPEYLMEDFGTNPDIDDKPPIPLRDALEKMKPFLMAYEGIQSHEEWEKVVEETMERVPIMKELVDYYSGPDRVTARKQQEELERVAKTLPDNAHASVKRFTERAVLSLQSNPGWGFDKKCQFMDKLVWEVSQHYK